MTDCIIRVVFHWGYHVASGGRVHCSQGGPPAHCLCCQLCTALQHYETSLAVSLCRYRRTAMYIVRISCCSLSLLIAAAVTDGLSNTSEVPCSSTHVHSEHLLMHRTCAISELDYRIASLNIVSIKRHLLNMQR